MPPAPATAPAEESDSFSDTESESDSDEEAATEHFEAHEEYIEKVAAIERVAREKIAALGEKPNTANLMKYQQKYASEMNKAQVKKHHADLKYAAKSFKREQKRALRALKRKSRQDRKCGKNAANGGVTKADVKAAQKEYQARIKKNNEEYREAVANYSHEIAYGAQDRGIDTHEAATSLGKGKTRSAWMVWLVISDLEEEAV